MRTRIAVSMLLLALGSALHAQDDRPMNGHWTCQTIQAENTTYFAKVWDENAYLPEVQTAWEQFLIGKYQFTGRPSCSVAYMSGSTFAKIDGDQARYVTQLRGQGIKVIETGWRFVAEQVRLPYFCFAAVTVRDAGKQQGYLYLTRVIPMPGNSQVALGNAWIEHTKSLRPGQYWNPDGCILLPASEARQQAAIESYVTQYTGQKYQIIHDDWSFTPGQPVAAADKSESYYCQLLQGGTLLYISGVNRFEEAYDWVAYRSAWQNFARSTLKVDPGAFLGGCDTGGWGQLVEARAARIAMVKGQAGSTVHEVDWKYPMGKAAAPTTTAAPAATAPAPAPAPVPAPAPARPAATYWCQWIRPGEAGQGGLTYYLTEPFTSTEPIATLVHAWEQHIADTWHPTAPIQGQAMCSRLASSKDSQQAVMNAVLGSAKASQSKVVRVPWSNQ